MRTSPARLLPMFRSESQLRMLGRLLLLPESPATMDDLRRATGMSHASLHRELHRAVDAGLVERDESRRPHVFRANRSSAMYEPVAALLRMTVGVQHDLRDLLQTTPGVDFAAIHGSWASNTVRPSSDIDLLVVGDDVEGRQLRAKLRDLGRRIGRDIDLTLVTRRNFDDAIDRDEPVIRRILERPLLTLVGDVPHLLAR